MPVSEMGILFRNAPFVATLLDQEELSIDERRCFAGVRKRKMSEKPRKQIDLRE